MEWNYQHVLPSNRERRDHKALPFAQGPQKMLLKMTGGVIFSPHFL